MKATQEMEVRTALSRSQSIHPTKPIKHSRRTDPVVLATLLFHCLLSDNVSSGKEREACYLLRQEGKRGEGRCREAIRELNEDRLIVDPVF